MRRLVLLAVLAVLVSSCGDASVGDPPTARDSLRGRVFVGDEVTGHRLVKGSTIRLDFTDGLGATGGCNHLGGTGDLEDGVLVATIDQMTEMGCEQPLMEQDDWLAAFLSSSPDATLDDNTLTLSKGGTTVRLTDEEYVHAQDPIPLQGTTWQLESLISGSGDDGAVSSVPGARELTLVIGKGSFTVDTGCNTISGALLIRGDTVMFKSHAMTLVSCPDVPDAQYARMFRGDYTFVQDYDVLTLTRSDGSSGVQFRAVR